MSVFYEVPRRIILQEVDVQWLGEECTYFAMSKTGVKHIVYEIASLHSYQDSISPIELAEDSVYLSGNHLQMTLQAYDAKWLYVKCPGFPENSLLRLKRSKVWGTFFDFKTAIADAYVAYPMDPFRLVSASQATEQRALQPGDYDTSTFSLLSQKEWDDVNEKQRVIGQPESKVLTASLQQIRPYSKVKVRLGNKWILGVTLPTAHSRTVLEFTEHPDSTLLDSFIETEHAISQLFIQNGSEMLVPDSQFTVATDLMYLQGLPEPLTEQELVLYGARILAHAKSAETENAHNLLTQVEAAITAAGISIQESSRVPLATYITDPRALHNQPDLLDAYLDQGSLPLPCVQPDFCNYGITLELGKSKDGWYTIKNLAGNIMLHSSRAVENLAPCLATSMGTSIPEPKQVKTKKQVVLSAKNVDPYGHSDAQWEIQNFSIKTFELRSLSNSKYQVIFPLCQLTLS